MMEKDNQQSSGTTINFNGNIINHGGTITGNIINPVYYGCGGESNLRPSEEKVKKAIKELDAEGTLSEDKQWYAIYKVLTKYCGYPTSMPTFCKNIEALKLEGLNHPCVYDNWRRVGQTVPHLPQNVDLWSNNQEEHSDLEKALANVATRLIELLTEPEN